MSQLGPPGPQRAGSALIPPPPARGRRRQPSLDRWLLWMSAFALGLGLGFAAYLWLPGVDTYFDYWLALLS